MLNDVSGVARTTELEFTFVAYDVQACRYVFRNGVWN